MDPDRFIKWKEVTEDDIKSSYRKTLLAQTSELKTSIVHKYIKKRFNSKKQVKSSDIASDLGVSTSTIARYKKDIGEFSSRKKVHRTHEEQNKITMKALITKLNNTDLNDDEYKDRYDKIVRKYGSHENQGNQGNQENQGNQLKTNSRIPRGGTVYNNEDNDSAKTASEILDSISTNSKALDKPKLATPTYDVEKLMQSSLSNLTSQLK